MTNPITRNWLKEAYEIAGNKKSRRTLKREHLISVITQFEAITKNVAILEKKMVDLYNSEVTRRKNAGLPPPPVPAMLQGPL